MNDLFSHYKNEKEDIYILENSDIVFIEIKISNNKSVLFDNNNNLIGFIIKRNG